MPDNQPVSPTQDNKNLNINPNHNPPKTSGTTVTLDIEGMTCASCVNRIEKKLSKVAGVSSVNVNLATEQGTVSYDPAQVSPEKLVKTVEAAGYKAIPLEVEAAKPVPHPEPAQTSQPQPQPLPTPVVAAALPGPAPAQPGTPTGSDAGEEKIAVAPATQSVELDIEGMTCASCVNRIEKKLSKVAGVSSVNVNLATERGTVIYDPAQVDPERLVKSVEAAGYKAIPLEIETPKPVQDTPTPHTIPIENPTPAAVSAAPRAAGGENKVEITPANRSVEMDIEGMTCASCVTRIERKVK